jgi:hypothetical protein
VAQPRGAARSENEQKTKNRNESGKFGSDPLKFSPGSADRPDARASIPTASLATSPKRIWVISKLITRHRCAIKKRPITARR